MGCTVSRGKAIKIDIRSQANENAENAEKAESDLRGNTRETIADLRITKLRETEDCADIRKAIRYNKICSFFGEEFRVSSNRKRRIGQHRRTIP